MDECNFIPDETLKLIATETLEILSYFDGLHFRKVEELVKIAEPTAPIEAN